MKSLRNTLVLCAALLLNTGLFGVSFSNTYYPTGSSPQTVVFVELNNDGYPDMVVGDGSKFLTVLLGSSTGKFTINSNIGLAGAPLRLVAGDFTQDGHPDVAVLEDGRVEIFGAYNGTLIQQGEFTFEGSGVDMIGASLDYGNRTPDLVITRRTSTGAFLDSYVNTTNPGDYYAKFLRVYERSLAATYPGGLVAADFDRNGIDDVAVVDGKNIRLLRSTGSGTFATTVMQTLYAPSGSSGLFNLAAGDLDVANGPDLVAQSIDACGPDCNDHSSLFVYLNGGSGTLTKKSTLDMGNMASGRNQLVDITGDNRLDLVHINVSVWSGQLSYARYKGNGTFDALTTVIGFEFPNNMAARDYNLDSRHDLAITDSVALATFAFKNTGATTICPPPKAYSLAAKICSPTTSSTGSTTFTVKGSGNSPVGVRRVELWVDGKKKYDSPDDQLRKTITLASGSHRLVVVAVDQYGATAKVTKYVTVP